MTKVDLIINAKHMYTMQGDGVGYLENHSIAVKDGKIAAIAPRADIESKYTADEVIGADHKVVLPGLIDGHMPVSYTHLKGMAFVLLFRNLQTSIA